MIRETYHRAWRIAAQRLPLDTRRDYLPGYAWLEVFAHTWVGAKPGARSGIVTDYLVDPSSVYRRALVRAGGLEALRLILRDTDVNYALWATDEVPEPNIDTVIACLVQVASAHGVRL